MSAKRNKHRCNVAIKCRCLLPERGTFTVCCGWRCRKCGGNMNLIDANRPPEAKG